MAAQNPVSTHPPAGVMALGYGGLIPFLSLAVVSVWGAAPHAWWVGALLAYGAVILSFVGALHWAFAMLLPGLSAPRRRYLYIWSTVPALVGWVAWALPGPMGLWLLAGGFVVHLANDQALVRQSTLPGWYWTLRLRLTAGAVSSLVLAAIGLMWV